MLPDLPEKYLYLNLCGRVFAYLYKAKYLLHRRDTIENQRLQKFQKLVQVFFKISFSVLELVLCIHRLHHLHQRDIHPKEKIALRYVFHL